MLLTADHQEIGIREAVPIPASSGSKQVNGPKSLVSLLRGKSLSETLLERIEPVLVALIAQLL